MEWIRGFDPGKIPLVVFIIAYIIFFKRSLKNPLKCVTRALMVACIPTGLLLLLCSFRTGKADSR